MSYKKLLALVSLLLIGAGCQPTNVTPPSPQEKAAPETTSDQQSIFEMKAKCATYKAGAEEKMKDTSWSSYHVDEVFYSPVKNSCLYAVSAQQDKGGFYAAFIIWDYFTGQMIMYRDTTVTKEQNISDMYQNARRYLKGEEELKFNEDDWELSDDF